MVLHVAGAELAGTLRVTALEFVEDLLVRLAHHGCEHVQAATVRHAHNNLAHAQCTTALDDLFQRRNRCLTTVQAEAFRARIPFVQEAFERFRFDKLCEDRLLALLGEGDALVRPFDTLLQPGFFFRIGNVHELDADGRAIGPLQNVEHLADGRMVEPEIAVDEDLAIHISRAKAIAGRVQFRLFFRNIQRQRIKLRRQMTPHPIGADHHDGADRILDVLRDFLGRGGRFGGFQLFLELRLDQRPVAVKGGHLFVTDRTGPVAALPARTIRILRGVCRIIVELRKEGAPALGN